MPFSSVLTGLRKAAGFSTAYRFYHDNGGQKVLGFSYRKYLLFEQGQTLPAPDTLRRLSLALRLIPKTPPAGRLATAWLRTTAGDEAYAEVFEPFISVKEETPGLSPAHKALGRFIKKQPLSVAQAEVILSSGRHYRAFLALVHDAGVWTCASLAKAAGLKPAEASAALRDLAGAGLLKKLKAGEYRFGGGRILEFPRAEIMPLGLNDRMRAYQAEMLASGQLTWRRLSMVRAAPESLAAFYPVLSVSISAAAAYETVEPLPGSAVFAVEARVVKLFNF